MNAPAISVDEVIINDQLQLRPTREPNYQAESRALVELSEVMSESPQRILQKLSDSALELCSAGSAGISIEERGSDEENFRWHATAGAYSPYVGGTMPRYFSPCGTVLERREALLMSYPVRFYPCISALNEPVVEVLLIPFSQEQVPIGTIWIVAHSPDRQFDAEDVRLLTSLSRFASAAVRTIKNLEALEATDRELRTAQARLDAALDAGSIATWTWNIRQNTLVGDGKLARLFSVHQQDGIDTSVSVYLSAVHPDDRLRVHAAIQDSLNRKESYECEYRVVNPDGVRWVFARGTPSFNAEGEVEWMAGAVVDITTRKAAEDAVNQSEQRLRALVTASSDAVYHMNADWTELNSIDGRGLVSSNSIPIRNWLPLHIPPAEQVRVIGAIDKAISNKETFELEHQVITSSGSIGWTYSRAVPILDSENQIQEWVGMASDITRSKAIEQELRESEGKYRTLFNSMDEGFCVIEVLYNEENKPVDYLFLETNPAFEKHTGLSNAIGKTVKHFAADHETYWFELYGAVVETGEPIRVQNEARALDGRWFDLFAFRVDDPTKRRVAIVFTNITERKRLEQSLETRVEQLAETDRRKDEFLAMLAHELRNPLAAINNAVAVSVKSGRPEHGKWAMEVISRQITHLTRLIEDLLDVSRINRGKIELRRDLLNLAPILESAAATVRPLIEERKHRFEISIDADQLWSNVDPTRLEQIIINLLSNAAKYSENGGLIRLSGRREGETIILSVTDFGPGIPTEKLPQMFELFVQGDRSLARSEGGLGIGLTVVKKLVEMHGGNISAKSEGPGKGTEFTVSLAATDQRSSSSQSAQPSSETGTRAAKILVVDDNPDTVQGMSRFLRLLGHEVITALSGTEAVALARVHHPEIVLLDIGLPEMDGYQVATALREDESSKEAVIIAVSGYGQEEDIRRSKDAGFDHHLVKPLDHDRLLSILSNAI